MSFTKDTLTNLDIFLGDKCNLKCIHCPCWMNRAPLELPAHLLWDRVAEAIYHVARRCARFDKIMLIGGEPFSHPGLPEFLRDQQFDTYLTVYTNFAHPLPEYDWPPNVHFITSMDAPDDVTYRRTRRTRDFSTVYYNLMRNAPWIIHADTTVSRLNWDKLDDLVALSERIGCTHWFLPIDPRVLRYANEHPNDLRVRRTAERLETQLLDAELLASVEKFYRRHQENRRMNDFSMFRGLYLAGTKHFDDLNDYATEHKSRMLLDLPGCPAGERYLEITFDQAARFVPVLYCPELLRAHTSDTVPHFDRFADLLDWLTEAFAAHPCRHFCGRTQFLGIDEYKDRFSEVRMAD